MNDNWIRAAQVAEQNHGFIAMHHLELLGINARERERMLAAGALLREWHGAYRVVGAPTSWKGELLAATAAIAREAGRPWLITCVAGTAPAFATLQQVHGFRVVMSPYQFVYRPYAQSLTRRHLFDHWRLSAGDLDFL